MPTDVYQQFMFELFGTSVYARQKMRVVRSEYSGEWNISNKSMDGGNIKAVTTYGTKRITAYHILEQTLNQRVVKVFDTVVEDGKERPVLNVKETAIAQDRQELIKSKFADWLWQDIDRRERLCRIYNDTFNSIRPREYDGSHIRFVGMNPEISLRKHQVNAIAHVLYGGNALLAHEVGCRENLGVASATINEEGKLVITYSDGTIATLGKVIGPRGEQGIQGEKGDTGAQGEKGEQGSQGEQGVQGIQGEKGEQGIQGEKGDKGDTGAAGQDGQDGQNGVGISRAEINAENELVLTLSNGQSINLGAVKGEKGDKGDAGVGIANVSITEAGNLKVTLTNNTSIDLGNIKGADGIGITKSEINAQGHLVLTYSDGNTSDLGVVVGQDGAKGVDGKDGADGVGISNVAVSTDGVLVITLSNDDVKTLGNIKGEKGEKGDKGDTGRGIDHMDIVDGELWVYYTDGTSQNLGSTGGSSEGSVLIFVELPDGTYGVKAGEKAKDVAVIEIPETYNGKAVTQIIANGFEKLTTLQQITFPNCLEKVGSYAFYGCTSLSSITIPENTTYIGKRAFYSAGLKTAKLSDATSWHAEPLATITKIRSDDDITDAFSSGLDLGSNSGYHNSWGSTYRVWFTCDLSDQTTAANALIGTYNGQGGYEREGFSKSYRFDASVNYYDVDWVKR